MNENSCIECKHSEPTESTIASRCTRFPPVLVQGDEIDFRSPDSWVQPMVRFHDVCGEFKKQR